MCEEPACVSCRYLKDRTVPPTRRKRTPQAAVLLGGDPFDATALLLKKHAEVLEGTIHSLLNDTTPDTSYLVHRLATGASSCTIRARCSGA
jgi:hypothetical protein